MTTLRINRAPVLTEHDPDPDMRPKPITLEKREDVIAHTAAGL
jgi:hypothetical protein